MGKEGWVERETLSTFSADLLCILPTTNRLAELLNITSHDGAAAYVHNWQAMFSQGDFYLGIQDHGLDSERRIHKSLKIFHQTQRVPVVAINDVRYIDAQDDIAYDCLQAMKQGNRWPLKITDPAIKQRHLRSTEEMNNYSILFGRRLSKKQIKLMRSVMLPLTSRVNGCQLIPFRIKQMHILF